MNGRPGQVAAPALPSATVAQGLSLRRGRRPRRRTPLPDVAISTPRPTRAVRSSVCLWCIDNLTLAVCAVVVSPFGLTGWLVPWANKRFDFAVLPHTPQTNGTIGRKSHES